MTRRAILQIGTEKTGTTSLQTFFKQNRERLSQRGYLYPRFAGDINQTGLAAFAMNDDRSDPLRDGWGAGCPGDVAPLRARLREAAGFEMADADKTVILCNEHCHSRLTHPEEVVRLRNFLSEFFDEITVSVYLRRQDQVAVSLYSTRLKSGDTNPSLFVDDRINSPYFNYDRFLSLWEEAFGVHNMVVRLFDRNELIGQSVISDFLSAMGIGTVEEFDPVPDQNESISPIAQEFLRRVNSHLVPPKPLSAESVRGPLVARLSRLFAGTGVRPARAEAIAFFEKFQASNDRVRQRYFPNRATLFSGDFSSYPDTADDRAFSTEALARVAAGVHVSWVTEAHRLTAEIEIRDAQLDWERGCPEEAIAKLRQTIGRVPDYPVTYRTLAEFLYRFNKREEAARVARQAAELQRTKAEYWHFLGFVLRSLGATEDATDAYSRSLAICPIHAESLQALAELRSSVDDPAETDPTPGEPGLRHSR